MRRIRARAALFAGSLLAAIASPVWALEPTKQTTAVPEGAATPTDGNAKNREGQMVSHDEKSDMPERAY